MVVHYVYCNDTWCAVHNAEDTEGNIMHGDNRATRRQQEKAKAECESKTCHDKVMDGENMSLCSKHNEWMLFIVEVLQMLQVRGGYSALTVLNEMGSMVAVSNAMAAQAQQGKPAKMTDMQGKKIL